jgi:hypothetical protein
LQEALLRLEPRMTLATGRIYYAEDHVTIDWKKLAYFALSVFWHGAADSWERSTEPGAKPFIELEATLQEHLRRFLLGEEDYPKGILLIMLRVSANLTPDAHMNELSFHRDHRDAGPATAANQFHRARHDFHDGPGSRSSGVALALIDGVPTYQVEDEEGRIHLLIHLAIEDQIEDRWCLWRPEYAGFDSMPNNSQSDRQTDRQFLS